MTIQMDVETRLKADGHGLDRDFPSVDILERRILARIAITPREERRRPTLPQELALAGLFVVAVALLAIGVARLRALTQPVPAHPTPSVRSGPVPAAALFPPSFPVKMVTPTVGWVGTGGDVSRTTDGGLHWLPVSPPPLQNETKFRPAIYFLDASHAWLARAIGSSAGCCTPPARLIISRTADGGRTWSAGDPVPANGVAVSAQLSFVDEQRGWLLTDVQTHQQPATPENVPEITNYDRGLTRTIYATNDGGLHWSRLVSAPQSAGSVLGTMAVGCRPSGLTFVSLDTGWLSFDCTQTAGPLPPGPSGPVVVATRDGGRSWQSVSLPSYPSDAICSAKPPVFSGSLGVLAVWCSGGSGGIYVTTDGGRTWSTHPPPVYSPIDVIDFIDAKNGWTASLSGEVYRTTNSARDWTLVGRLSVLGETVHNVQFLDSKVGFALAVGEFASTTLRTTDGGRTWEVVERAPLEGQ